MAQMAQRDYYEILGVERNASAAEIRRAYKKLALKNHPDRNAGDDEATARFKEAAEAYDVLGDDEKRSRYDRFGHAGVKGAGPQFQDASDVFDAFGDLFDFFGGGRRRRGSRGGPQRGDDLRTSVSIELKEAATGVSQSIRVNRHKACDRCGGDGAEPGTSPETCDYCGGAGQVVQAQGFFRLQTTCPACRGAGRIVRHKCNSCYGSGQQDDVVDLDVKIPAGVDNGMRLCLRGEGDPGPSGGPRGDLYVDIHVREHALFHRQGTHLICRVPITYTQAVLGASIEIPTIDGSGHDLVIPPGTQPGDVIRLRGQGMPDPQGGSSGDMHVEVQLEVPKRVSDEHEELLRQLADHEHADVTPHRTSFFEKVRDFFTLEDE